MESPYLIRRAQAVIFRQRCGLIDFELQTNAGVGKICRVPGNFLQTKGQSPRDIAGTMKREGYELCHFGVQKIITTASLSH
jgi:hypothetical protein